MILPARKNRFALDAFSALFFFGILLLLLNSCGSGVKDDHPQYFGKVLHAFDTSANINRAKIIASIDSAINAAPAVGRGDKIEIYRRKSEYYIDFVKDYEKAFRYIDSMQVLCEDKLKDQRFASMYAFALFKKGDIYAFLKNYDESIKYYIEGKQFVTEKLKDTCELSGYSGRIANMVYRQGKYLLAAGYYRDGYYEEQACQKDPFLKYVYGQGNLNNVGLCYYDLGMLDSANHYFQAAMNYINKRRPEFPEKANFTKVAIAVTNGNLARVADKHGDFKQAEQLYRWSIKDAFENDADYARLTQFDLAKMYVKSNQLEKAEQLMNDIDSTSFSHLMAGNGRLKHNRLRSDLYDKKQQPQLAHIYLQQYVSIRDSIDEAEKRIAAIDIGKEFENREQKAINQLLKKQNEVKSFQLTVALLLSALAIMTIAFVWVNLKRSASHVKDLERLNAEVHQKNNGLEKLNNEVLVKNEDLNKAFMSLEQSHSENTKITRMVAHDLKNPIGGIHALVHSLLKKEQPEELHENLELIRNACANSITLINDLLMDKKAQEDTKKEMVDMARLLEYCVALLQAKADEKNQQLQLQSDTVMIAVNRQKIWRVVSNILNNAIKFSPENKVIIVKLAKRADTVLLSVEDDGIGIPLDLKDKIFTLQPEASRTGTAGEASHGLGLSISRKIVEEHHGRLWFESKEGEGCTFFVELPYAN